MLSPALQAFHDAVYVVTAPGFDQRQQHVREELGGGNFEFVFSLSKYDTSIESLTLNGTYDEAEAIRLDRSSKPMTLGHICCSLGHRRAYERFLATDGERCLIFEDDVIDLGVSESDIEAAITDAPSDADLIYWGWEGGGYRTAFGKVKQALYHVSYSLGTLKYNHTMIRNLYSRPFNAHFDRAGKHFLAHAYSVTRRGAEKLIEWNTPIRLNGDNCLLYAVLNGDVSAYIARKPLFGQGSAAKTGPLTTVTAT